MEREMLRLYLDTEFTSLNPFTYGLVSLALVAADGRELYFELLDGWQTDECSEFVREVVLPQLDLPRYGLTTLQAQAALASFLKEVGQGEILSDALKWDWPLLVQLLGKSGLPEGIVCSDIPGDLELSLEDPPHHALHDARLLCRAVESALQNRS